MKMKIFPKELNNKSEMAEKRFSNLQRRTIEIIQYNKDTRLKNEQTLGDM